MHLTTRPGPVAVPGQRASCQTAPRAQELLETTDLPVEDVAERAGFGSAATSRTGSAPRRPPTARLFAGGERSRTTPPGTFARSGRFRARSPH
ncbi:hypothetical protein F1721_21270 [Saccharopolyspora hirsuta]|uniref:Helix-turn-helix domain-containing protein n=1 Tax=Saccharopolyspora hirsuta TaxID=1837 RepID=A0A5M7BN83_SACHI|nr:hypothetical protein F1721_21270 [Saccharopolyspora hirsuta]